ETASLLPAGLPQLPPTTALKERILSSARSVHVARAEGEKEERESSSRAPSFFPWLSWRTLGLAFVLVIMIVRFSMYFSSLLETIDQQNERLVAGQTQITE